MIPQMKLNLKLWEMVNRTGNTIKRITNLLKDINRRRQQDKHTGYRRREEDDDITPR